MNSTKKPDSSPSKPDSADSSQPQQKATTPATTGQESLAEIAMRYGGRPIPPDDPIFKQGFVVGATKPYRQRPTRSAEASSEAPLDPNVSYTPDHPDYERSVKENPMLPAQNGLEEALKRMGHAKKR